MTESKHVPLAPRDLLILAVLSDGPLHGYGMIKAVEARSRSGVLLDPANLYRVLRRMRRSGWIEHHPSPELRQRVYELTGAGRRVLSAEVQRLQDLLSDVQLGGAVG